MIKRFLYYVFVFLFVASVNAQAFAMGACCFKNSQKQIETTSKKNAMPCHNMASSESEFSKSKLSKSGADKSKKSCCCDVSACASKVVLKSGSAAKPFSVSKINFKIFEQKISTFKISSAEQPPKLFS